MHVAMKATLIAALVTVAVVIPLAVFGGSAAASHGSGGNYTVDLPHQSDHLPGDQNPANASIHHLAGLGTVFTGTPSEKGFETAEWLVIRSSEIDFSECKTEDTAGFGIDRGNDDPGTETNENLLDHRKDSSFNPNSIVVEFFDDDDIAGNSVSINAEDQIIAVQTTCYTMPSEPGWYQIFGKLNGTGYNGNQFEVSLNSHYFYICDCASAQEARQQLGPPPSEQDASEATVTPTATATAARTTSTGGTSPEDTPSPAAATGTSTRARQQDNGGSGATATRTAKSTGAGNAGGGQTAGATVSGPVTPTIAEGPGFGPVAAFLALVAAALVAGRRD